MLDNDNTYQQWLDFDKNHLWHPYTSAVAPLPCYPFESAQGSQITLATGDVLVDGMSSWWSAIHGYNNEALNQAAIAQLNIASHIMFGGLTHKPAVTLAEKLLALAPSNMDFVFLADSGSVSVEVAIKMAVQYFHAQGKPEKNKLAAFRGGYHGDTAGAMAACDPITGMHSLYADLLPQHLFLPKPTCRFDEEWSARYFDETEALLRDKHPQLCAIIVEPIVQGAGGMWFYHPHYLKSLRTLCDELDILLIFDEIATGFGRTGKMFAWQWANSKPDIMTVGKALTGGYMTLAATMASAKVARGISADGGVLMHGPTFMGNPLACAVANASLNLLEKNGWQEQVMNLQQSLSSLLAPCAKEKNVSDVRVLGAIGVVEMQQDVDVADAQAYFVKHGAWIRPFGKLIYVMPPYISTANDLEVLSTAIHGYIKMLNQKKNPAVKNPA